MEKYDLWNESIMENILFDCVIDEMKKIFGENMNDEFLKMYNKY